MRYGWLQSYYLDSWLVLELVVTRLPDRCIVGMEVHWVCSYPGRTSRTQFLRDLVLECRSLELLHTFQQKEDYKNCLHIKEKKVKCLLSPHMWWKQLTKTVLDSGFHADDSGFHGLELLQYKCTILATRVRGTSLTPPLFGKKLESDCQFMIVNTAMLRSPPPEQS